MVQFVWLRNVATHHQPACVNLAKPVENGRRGGETPVPSVPSVAMAAEKDVCTRAVQSGNWCFRSNDVGLLTAGVEQVLQNCRMLRLMVFGNSGVKV